MCSAEESVALQTSPFVVPVACDSGNCGIKIDPVKTGYHHDLFDNAERHAMCKIVLLIRDMAGEDANGLRYHQR